MLNNKNRSGTILIIVSGLCALMASLSIAFIVRMKSDAEESRLVMADAQARIMLVAGLNYIQEASRLGWDDLNTPMHEESYGWIDVRDGLLGPKTSSANPNTGVLPVRKPEMGPPSKNFPIGSAGRFPMFMWERPPCAVQLTNSYNPMPQDSSHADFGLPYLRYPDPQPIINNAWEKNGPPSNVNDSNFGNPTLRTSTNLDTYLHGDPRPRTNSLGMSWFRVYRKGPATFIITCGAGGSGGHRSWATMSVDDKEPFGGDQTLWENLRAEEIIMWFEAEWNPAVGGATYQCIDNEQHPDHYQWRPFNTTHEGQSQPHARNMVGTFRYIQRLRDEPDNW